MDAGDRGQNIVLAQRAFHADALVLVHAQEMPDHVEPAVAGGPIDGRDVHEGRELAGRIGPQPFDEAMHRRRHDLDRQLAMADTDVAITASGLRSAIWAASSLRLSTLICRLLRARWARQRVMVPVRRIFRCSCRHTVKQRLGRGRAARHVDVDRHDPVAAAHHAE
jgi:hypothetical protein